MFNLIFSTKRKFGYNGWEFYSWIWYLIINKDIGKILGSYFI